MVTYPKPLHPGDLIAVTAPSSGVSGAALARRDLALEHLRMQGYRVVEGECLRSEHKNASAIKKSRASELSGFLHDPEVAAIFPPWGGELASELSRGIVPSRGSGYWATQTSARCNCR